MDVWVVAAAAGAGYVAQRLKNLTRGKDKWLDSSYESFNIVRLESSSIRHNVEDKSCQFSRVLPRKSFGEEREREHASAAEKASTSGYKVKIW